MKKPLGDRVIIKPDESITVSEGGMEFSNEGIEKPASGVIMATGSRCIEGLKEGDKVTYGKYSGQTLTIEEVDYLIMKENEIIAVE
jgi:chaperonin GroES